MTADEVALLILAGGRSERFGSSDKLLADLGGAPLGLHVANRLAPLNWAMRIAVTSPAMAHLFSGLGYTPLSAAKDGGMGDNIARGVKAVTDARAMLIVLADMPFVSLAHMRALLDAATADDSIVASSCADTISPPVLFGRAHFTALNRLSGDRGARHLISAGATEPIRVAAPPAELVDIDTPDDLKGQGDKAE